MSKASIDLKVQYFFHKKYLNNLEFYTNDLSICAYENRNAMCCIKPNGDVLPCPVLLNFVIGNVLEEKLNSLWKSVKMRKIKELKIKDLGKCGNCEHVALCGGGCRASAYVNFKELAREDLLACSAMDYFENQIKPLLREYER